MGATESDVSNGAHEGGPRFYKKQILASNTGKCVEDSYPEGAILLNCGSGSTKWDGWIGVDLDPDADHVCDIRKLDFDDNIADAICSVHVVEHVYEWEAGPMLTEWKRVLKPGGRLILELPCMDKVIRYMANVADQKTLMSPTFSWWALWGDPSYRNALMTHKWGYTIQMISQLLIKCGYEDVKYEKPRYHFPQRDMRITAVKPLTT